MNQQKTLNDCNRYEKIKTYRRAKQIKKMFENKWFGTVGIFKCNVCKNYHVKKTKIDPDSPDYIDKLLKMDANNAN